MKELCIILSAGKINPSNLPTNFTSNSMIPIIGKPVIGWIIDDLIDKNIKDITLVVRKNDKRLQNYVNSVYTTKANLKFEYPIEGGTIIHSLLAGLNGADTTNKIHVVLGDTLVKDDFNRADNFIYVANVFDSKRWCIINLSKNGDIETYINKKNLPTEKHLAIIGYYHFSDGDHLLKCAIQSEKNNERELSDVLTKYTHKYKLKPILTTKWFDFGNVDNLIEAKRNLLQSRYFNYLSIDPIFKTITKSSKNSEKLLQEINWYLNIPEKLKILTPRIIEFKKDDEIKLVQEYYGYPTLAELYVHGEINSDIWFSILNYVLKIHEEFLKYTGKCKKEDYEFMYFSKVKERLDLLKNISFWESILKQKSITLNGNSLDNFSTIENEIQQFSVKLATNTNSTIIHGDYCFSNMLFDVNNFVLRLIDPRGNFGKCGIYGDPRYDIAKLRHSINGLYDFVLSDMFTLNMKNNEYVLNIHENDISETLSLEFDKIIQKMGYNLDEIRFIEGLLFVSMIPFHKDYPNRQLAMFLKGLSLLNNVIR